MSNLNPQGRSRCKLFIWESHSFQRRMLFCQKEVSYVGVSELYLSSIWCDYQCSYTSDCGFGCIIFHLYGRSIRCFSVATLSDEFPAFYKSFCKRYQLYFQHSSYPQRHLPLPQRRTHGMAPYVGNYTRYPSRCFPGLLHQGALSAWSESFQIICRLHLTLHWDKTLVRIHRQGQGTRRSQ